MHNTGSLRQVLCRILSFFLAILISIMMIPFASIDYAFADIEQNNAYVDSANTVNGENIPEIKNDNSSQSDDENTSRELNSDENDEEAQPDREVDAVQSLAESFRFHDGKPIENGISAQNIGTHYPNTFVRYDEGYHTRSDAFKGIDVSYWQGSYYGYTINWSQVKAAGIDFAIIRSGDGSFNDPDFVRNVKGCLENQIPFGVYYYARATDAAGANTEADRVFARLSAAGVTPNNITYPIYYDIENSKGTPNYLDLGTGVVDTITSTFIARMNAAGYKAGVYSNTSWFTSGPCSSSYINNLQYRWCAQYNSAGLRYKGWGTTGDALKNSVNGMWQFTRAGRVSGISTNVDLNYSYLGFQVRGDASITDINKDGGTFRVKLNITYANWSVSSVGFYVWCYGQNGQDDLRWYPAGRLPDGTYYVDVSIKDHKGYIGDYVAHSYVYSSLGQSVGADGSMSVNANIAVNPKNETSPTLASDNFSVTYKAKGGEFARASAVTTKAWLHSEFSSSSTDNLFSPQSAIGEVISHPATKSGDTWNCYVNIHHHRKAGFYKLETWVTINGTEQKISEGSFTISSYADPGIPMYRLYNPVTSEHFYTASAGERDNLAANHGWNYEGVGWIAASGGTPVYRLYNPGLGDHHYTTSAGERDWLVASHGWKYEGIGWYTDGSYPLYRLYNGRLKSGQHHYTTSENEKNVNVKRDGWTYEGVGWYALRPS